METFGSKNPARFTELPWAAVDRETGDVVGRFPTDAAAYDAHRATYAIVLATTDDVPVLAHPHNRILDDFRGYATVGASLDEWAIEQYLYSLSLPHRVSRYRSVNEATDAEREHATVILTRLLRWVKARKLGYAVPPTEFELRRDALAKSLLAIARDDANAWATADAETQRNYKDDAADVIKMLPHLLTLAERARLISTWEV